MKNYIIASFITFLSSVNLAQSQFIDSAWAQYSLPQSELTIYVEGWILWTSYAGITKFIASQNNDTVVVETYYMPCQTGNMSADYDTTYTVGINLSSGMKVVKLVNIHDTLQNVGMCRLNYDSKLFRIDSTYLNLFVPIGIQENHSVKYTVSPNPVHSILHLDIPTQEKIVVIKISDAFGREIKTTEIENGQLDVSHLTNGVYFLNVETSRSKQVLKFVKTN